MPAPSIATHDDFRPPVPPSRQGIPSSIRMDSLLEEAYVLQVEGRSPAFVFGYEEHPTGSLGAELDRIARSAQPRVRRVVEDWEDRAG